MSQSRLRAQPPSAPALQGACKVSTAIVGVNKGRVTVNNEADSRIPARVTVAPVRPGIGTRQPVTITPISPFVPPATPKPPVIIQKVLLKAVSKVGKQVSKMFTLRNIDVNKIVSRDNLMGEIRGQLRGDIVSSDFDVGYVCGNSVISIRNPDDLAEIWLDITERRNKVVLWCDGLKMKDSSGGATSSRRRQATGSESDEEEEIQAKSQKKKKKSSAQEDREEKVQTTMEQLKEKHGTVYTPMQLRIWSESIVGGIHSSLEEAPTSSMFAKAGKGPTKKKEQSSMSEALTQAALAISTAFSPRAPLPSSSSNQPLGTSPAKEIESRSKCYKQLNELNQLRSSGIITEDEYFEEKESVMCVLRKLKGN